MVSKELIQEFREIVKAEYGLDLSFEEASKTGNDLVDIFDTLARIDFEEKRNSSLSKWIFVVTYSWWLEYKTEYQRIYNFVPWKGRFLPIKLPLVVFIRVIQDRPFLLSKNWFCNNLCMPEKDRIKYLKFHVRSKDYFGTLATILDLFRLDVLEKKFIYDKDKVLEKIVKDLVYLQDNYKIVKKD